MKAYRKRQHSYKYFTRNAHRYNILGKEYSAIVPGPLFSIVPVTVRLNSDLTKGDFWPTQESMRAEPLYTMKKQATLKLSHAAGIVWDPRFTRRTDDRKNPRRVEFQATASVLAPDGRWMTVTRTKEVDLDAIERNLRSVLNRDLAQGKFTIERDGNQIVLGLDTQEGKSCVEQRLSRIMLKWEINKLAWADTCAHKRVISALLNMNDTYTKEEIQKPFVVPRVSFNARRMLKDPILRRELLHSSIDLAFAPRSERRCNHVITEPTEGTEGTSI